MTKILLLFNFFNTKEWIYWNIGTKGSLVLGWCLVCGSTRVGDRAQPGMGVFQAKKMAHACHKHMACLTQTCDGLCQARAAMLLNSMAGLHMLHVRSTSAQLHVRPDVADLRLRSGPRPLFDTSRHDCLSECLCRPSAS